MDVVVLSVVCGVGLLAALAAVVAWGGLETRPRPLLDPEADAPTVWSTTRRLLRSFSIALLAGGGAGVLTAGLGGRLLMRVLAATSSDRVQGFPTEAEETIGEITAGGTVGLVVFVGVAFGVLGGVLYLGLRRWLPGRAAGAGLLLGVLALALGPVTDVLDQSSTDFELLGPDPLSVVLIVALLLLSGATVASVVERADRSWPRPEGRPRPATVLAYGPLVLAVPVPVLGAGFVVVLLATLALQRSVALRSFWTGEAVDVGGRLLLALAVVIALGIGVVQAAGILTGEDLAALVPPDRAAWRDPRALPLRPPVSPGSGW